MTIRERTQAIERQILAPCATLSEQTAGRRNRNRNATSVPHSSGIGIGLSTVKRSGGSNIKHRCFCPRKGIITGRA